MILIFCSRFDFDPEGAKPATMNEASCVGRQTLVNNGSDANANGPMKIEQ